jgi:hypothetical protein
MTAQIPDRVRYGRKLYDVVGIGGEGLFEPGAHGLSPVPPHSACWRGFVCTYALVYEMLWVDFLDINLQEGGGNGSSLDQAPSLNDVPPIARQGECDFDTYYERVRLRVPFNGTLLVGRDFADDQYFDWWFNPLLRYNEVHRLAFEDGRLVSALDMSDQVAEERNLARRELETRKDSEAWR